jgi:hypothetical protein
MQAYQERQSGMAPAFAQASRHRADRFAFRPFRSRDSRSMLTMDGARVGHSS